tara:strand:+ start:223 stop:1335 length:1113 start_codon:yes stop_codon:yes gene_type:complete
MKFAEIKKFLLKKGFRISKIQKTDKNNNLKTISLTFFFSLIIIGIFSILPYTMNKISQIYYVKSPIDNNSKQDFDRIFEGKETVNKSNLDKGINEKNLFDDIIELNESPTSSVRLSASTLEELFKETDYNLKKIRKSKIVKPVEIGLLPKEIKKIENSQKRKDLFIKIILPLILEENSKILLDRKRLFVILNKSINTKSEKEWLKQKLKQYGVVNNDLSTLKVRMDIIPTSLAIAQAAKETGWGTSRFALEGNALFGQWTYSDNGIKPASADQDSKHKVMRFKVLKASVRAYQRNLNTHSSYREFRKMRAMQRDNDEKISSLGLVKYLDEYAETGVKYTEVLKKIIEQNNLTDFDDAKILPTSKKLKSLI